MPRDKKARNDARNARADHQKGTRQAYEKARRRVLATQTICGICGAPVDKSLPAGHPLSATVDHIIPLSRGGSLLDPDNLQLAHLACNRAKSSRIQAPQITKNKSAAELNRDLPQTFDWANYRAKDSDGES